MRSSKSERHVERCDIADIQRARIIAAMYEVCAEHGAPGVTVGAAIARARVSRRTFYELFASAEDCLAAAFEEALAVVAECVIVAAGGGRHWRDSARRALVALLAFLDEQPLCAHLLIVESASAGPRLLERRAQVFDRLAIAVDKARGEPGVQRDPSPLTPEGVVGAVLAVIHRRMLDKPESPSLLALANQLMSIVVLPYFGAEAARAELRRAPDARPAKPRASRVPPQDLQMRLTYRTVRVLHAIDSHPGASNRQVAQASGVADQGQISKLLRRLQRLGLIENIGDGQSKGAPNAWTLTSRGLALRQALIAGVGLERQ